MTWSPVKQLPLVGLLAGLCLTAGPWIAVLSLKYDRPVYANAGRANHANVGPEVFGLDLLWHPPLTPDYIMEPVIAAEWSPLANLRNFRHQAWLVAHNASNCVGLIPGWLALLGVAWAWRLSNLRKPTRQANWDATWASLSALIYCSGYVMVNLETRYIVPVVAPLLCAGAAALLRDISFDFDNSAWPKANHRAMTWIAPTAVALVFGVVDLFSIGTVVLRHPQTESMAKFRFVAGQLQQAGLSELPMACNRYHTGLYVAHASFNTASYLGQPQSNTPARHWQGTDATRDRRLFAVRGSVS